jgi:hypothetical protein
LTDLQNPTFNDVEVARKAVEDVRWPHGPWCPYCGKVKAFHIHRATKLRVRVEIVRHVSCPSQLHKDEGRIYTEFGISGSPIGGLVKPKTPRQLQRKLWRIKKKR